MTTNSKVYPFYRVTIKAQPSGKWGYIKKSMDPRSFLYGSVEWTQNPREAEEFGKDMAHQVAAKRNGKVKTVTGLKKKSSKPKPVVVPLPTAQKKVIVGIALDSSGSMSNVAAQTKIAVNSIIQDLREQSKKHNIKTTVTLWLFGVGYAEIRESYNNLDADKVEDLTAYRPEGMTPLYECVGRMMERLDSLPMDEHTSILLHTITDGYENASHGNWSNPSNFAHAVRDRQQTDKWTFSFLLPPGHKANFVAVSGVHEGNCREWEASTKGVQEYTQSVVSSTQQYYGAAAVATRSHKTANFFTTDMSGVKASDIKKKLDDVSDRFIKIEVDKETAIEPLVTSKGYSYRKGDAFYCLTKKEKIQSHKKILIREKGKKVIYSGKEARNILGLPDYEVPVVPGNHANFDIFVESNSTNRKCVRGTQILVLKPGQSLS